ncbi:MAG: peroxiredoxin family protein [Chloroflexi bacterium]|nr:peroxiredoxin family protein [Chloroflexota bacterium]
MVKRKRKSGEPWWRKRKVVRRLALLAGALVAAAGLTAWALVPRGGGGGDTQYLREPAPPFTLPTIAGDEVSLADHLGQHNLLLFFNEGIGCGPCFDQVVDLEADWERFKALDLELVSIMVDPLPELKSWAADYGITTVVASDESKSVPNAYDAMEASMHPGAKPGHTFVLVNKEGQIIWRRDWIGHGQAMYYEVDEIYKDVADWLERAG